MNIWKRMPTYKYKGADTYPDYIIDCGASQTQISRNVYLKRWMCLHWYDTENEKRYRHSCVPCSDLELLVMFGFSREDLGLIGKVVHSLQCEERDLLIEMDKVINAFQRIKNDAH